ncbi:MAG: hypothetical protein IH597_16090 [Bacteroidales bacterium]|nr:hypothetical protein [Bacteroidales bacterium]
MSEYLFSQSEHFIVANLKRLWRCDELIMIGEYQYSSSPKEQEFGYISRPYINDRNIYYPVNDHKRHVAIRILKSDDLIVGNYYKIKAKLAPLDLRKQINNPYMLVWDDSEPIVFASEFITPREFIESWFHQTGSTPKDAATIASQLKLNSLELYTQTERFIFELIQNADDMPASVKGVCVELHLLNNFLLFRHNGKFFDRDDVRAIADAAQSNKSENVRQTGYKGIGFKSVFTDSSCVYIRSGSYSFKFDKNDPIYNDFNTLYGRQIRLLSNSPKDYEQFQMDYSKNIEKYENIDNIPWQIKPIWVSRSEFPDELANSEFIKHAEVNIALQIVENVIKAKNYAFMIESILSKPKFILFLRNTKKFDYFKLDSSQLQKQQSIELKEDNSLIDIVHNDNHVATFSKLHFDVEINNEEFSKAGFNMKKFEEKEGVFKFKDEFGEIKSIPEKLGLLSSTRMTFASQIKDGEVIKLDKSHSILYNYLPTSDQRFGFPFLVNADFITNTSREFILKENKWNQYLMYHIGKNCIRSLVSLCNVQESVDGVVERKYVKSYLQLLPDSLLNEDDDELSEINKSFNRGFLDSINHLAFIIDLNGNVQSTNEIIIDETNFSKILNPEIFKIVSETERVLPAKEISNHILNKDYLNIEKYTADKLTLHLQGKDKHISLSKALSSLDTDGYNKFLEWLDQFYHLNNLKEEWLLQLPIIRKGESIVSLSDAIGMKDFVSKTAKTIEIEDILQKLGFTLSEFSLDDESVKHIKQVLLSKESHLQSDTKLYNHITLERDLSVLQPDEKNRILNFFKGLYQIGPSDYAGSLKLFQSQTRKARSLNNLISNKEIEKLPKWLLAFVILEAEELAISTEFQKELLLEKDLLEKIFCNAGNFNEIIANINLGNLEEFYTYILKLNKDKPEDAKIDFSAIPWVFVESTATFAISSSIYWPESFTKITDAQKYSSVKSVIETISEERLPHYAVLQIKTPFALGGKDLNLTAITPKQNSFDVIAVNNFLDWAQDNVEKELLKHLSFTKVDEKFSMGKISGTLAYYTNDEALISFIEGSSLNTKLSLFPKELFTKERNKLGLLEGIPLLIYLIEKGLATTDFARFIQDAKDSALSLKYLDLLPELNIDSSKCYTADDAVYRILKLASSQIIDDAIKLDSFREKVSLDGVKLLEKAVSADVRMFDANDKFVYQFQTIELSDILPAYKGKTYPVSEIVDLFLDFRDSENLKKIFKAKSRGTKRIYKELSELKLEAYNAAQTFFLSYLQSIYPNEAVLKDKVFFSLNSEVNQGSYKRELHLFLGFCVKENRYTDFVAQGVLLSLTPSALVSSNDYAIDSEKLPMWLSEWLNSSDTDSKNAFVKLLGVNDDESPVVLLRKAIKEGQLEAMNVNREKINTDSLLINSLTWLSKEHASNQFTIKKEVLQPLYQKLLNRKVTIDKLLFPCVRISQENSYSLQAILERDELHYLHDGWGAYKRSIYSNLVSSKKITDDVLPKAYRDAWKVIEKPVVKLPDIENLKANSNSFEEEYYLEWDLKSQYNIQIYKGALLPYLIKYNDLLIDSVKEKYAECIEKVYYVVEPEKEGLLIHLKGIMAESVLNSLKLNKQNLLERNKQAEKKIQFTEEESAIWKKLFGNEIPESYYQDINLAACVSALVVLNYAGYNVSKADSNLFNSHGFAQVEPVFKGDSEKPLTIMCRSAIGGILYLTAQAWDRLDNPEIHLFVKTGRKESNHNLFLDKTDVLKVSDTKYQVFRVEADSSSVTTDQILRGEFARDKIWLILKMKETETYQSIFEGGIKRNEENPDYNNVNTSENSPY